jgi:type I restriction enzyme S subunit
MKSEVYPDHQLEVPQGWECYPLDNFVDNGRGISYGIVQPGQNVDVGISVVRVNNIRHGRIETRDILRVSPAIEANHQRTRLHGGEVLLSLVGTLGECAVVPLHLAGWNVARAVAVIPLADNVDSRWISICLQSAPVQHLMRSWATTTVQATLNLRDVRRLPILFPPRPIMAAIVEVVGALDDKIESNRRTSRMLERMTRTIFRGVNGVTS